MNYKLEALVPNSVLGSYTGTIWILWYRNIIKKWCSLPPWKWVSKKAWDLLVTSSRFLIHSIIMLGNVGTCIFYVPAILCKSKGPSSTRVPCLPADEFSFSESEKARLLHEAHSGPMMTLLMTYVMCNHSGILESIFQFSWKFKDFCKAYRNCKENPMRISTAEAFVVWRQGIGIVAWKHFS